MTSCEEPPTTESSVPARGHLRDVLNVVRGLCAIVQEESIGGLELATTSSPAGTSLTGDGEASPPEEEAEEEYAEEEESEEEGDEDDDNMPQSSEPLVRPQQADALLPFLKAAALQRLQAAGPAAAAQGRGSVEEEEHSSEAGGQQMNEEDISKTLKRLHWEAKLKRAQAAEVRRQQKNQEAAAFFAARDAAQQAQRVQQAAERQQRSPESATSAAQAQPQRQVAQPVQPKVEARSKSVEAAKAEVPRDAPLQEPAPPADPSGNVECRLSPAERLPPEPQAQRRLTPPRRSSYSSVSDVTNPRRDLFAALHKEAGIRDENWQLSKGKADWELRERLKAESIHGKARPRRDTERGSQSQEVFDRLAAPKRPGKQWAAGVARVGDRQSASANAACRRGAAGPCLDSESSSMFLSPAPSSDSGAASSRLSMAASPECVQDACEPGVKAWSPPPTRIPPPPTRKLTPRRSPSGPTLHGRWLCSTSPDSHAGESTAAPPSSSSSSDARSQPLQRRVSFDVGDSKSRLIAEAKRNGVDGAAAVASVADRPALLKGYLPSYSPAAGSPAVGRTSPPRQSPADMLSRSPDSAATRTLTPRRSSTTLSPDAAVADQRRRSPSAEGPLVCPRKASQPLRRADSAQHEGQAGKEGQTTGIQGYSDASCIAAVPGGDYKVLAAARATQEMGCVPKRVDPDDGRAYTLSEYIALWTSPGGYEELEVKEYWLKHCKPEAARLSTAEEAFYKAAAAARGSGASPLARQRSPGLTPGRAATPAASARCSPPVAASEPQVPGADSASGAQGRPLRSAACRASSTVAEKAAAATAGAASASARTLTPSKRSSTGKASSAASVAFGSAAVRKVCNTAGPPSARVAEMAAVVMQAESSSLDDVLKTISARTAPGNTISWEDPLPFSSATRAS
eukprot:TRINITY_DN49056_c0_g1_i1.p1 TRINITY_DN49056_c0_g1~~TRINITY_DN49056_c0_g1_i1.p1  ORF type:complete len:980 (-),score=220.26 TRINITY_DN49056_c0_g1_i1:68-2803(-)